MDDNVLCDAIGAVIADVAKDFQARIRALEARISALEARPQPRYLGVWDAARQYDEGAMTTKAGSVWYCNRTTRDEPGASTAWSLAVKRGRNGRDVRNDA